MNSETATDSVECNTTQISPKTKKILLNEKYLNFPLGKNTLGSKLKILVEGKLLGEFNIDLQEEDPFFWGFIDVDLYKGKTAEIIIDNCNTDLSRITNDKEIAESKYIYKENYRPQYHFTTKRGWLNDPNGLIYLNGKYHMYYQYNPMGVFWENMSWGHAVSNDLIFWKEETPVLYPLPTTGACFTGSCFIDKENLLGLKKGNNDAVIAYYLRTNSGLSYAYSGDGGFTFTDYDQNPVIAKPVSRERIDSPKPTYYEPAKKWIAPVFDDRFEIYEKDKNSMTVSLYSSNDLKTWIKESDIGDIGLDAECPDLFQLPLDNDPKNKLWVLMLGNASYIIGHFDGKRMYNFKNEPATQKDIVKTIPNGHYYASMTWDNIPVSDGRRIQIAWMKKEFNESTSFPVMPFNQQMSLPMELTLRSTSDGPRIFMNPVNEVVLLRSKQLISKKNFTLTSEKDPLADIQGDLIEIYIKVGVNSTSKFCFNIRGTQVKYNASENILQVNDITGTLVPENDTIELRLFVDVRSLEVIANKGRMFIPVMQYPENDVYSLQTDNNHSKIEELTVYALQSIW